MNNNETKICQNCKNPFIIEPDDFSFYGKMKVPPPTFCPACRMQRRLMFRNERVFYKRECEMCHKSVISIYKPENNFKIFCHKCWWSDSWDPGEYYIEYDPNKNFFEQLKELQLKTPFEQKITDYGTVVNSDYINHAGSCKNCYLIFTADFCENVYYASTIAHCKDSMEGMMWNKVELSYEIIDGNGSKMYFSEGCNECVDVWFSKDLLGCLNCFGCVNLRNKSYHFFNEPCTKEEYQKKISEYNLGSYETIQMLKQKAYDFWLQFPRRAYYGRQNMNSTGDYIYYTKNAKNCYQGVYIEDSSYCQFVTLPTIRDCYDFTDWGNGADRCVDVTNVGEGAYEIHYSVTVWNNVRNVEYSMYVINCTNCFGCINLRKKEYCILNKQYTKEEYFILRDKIIADLEKNPYIDRKGRVFKYGEFMPYDISPFAYNESFAQQYFPLDKTAIESAGFSYIEPKNSEYNATIQIQDIPDDIKNISDDFTKEVIHCGCGKFYRIVAGELQLLKRFGIPIPRKCSDCRHVDRMKRVNPPFLYDRQCDKCHAEMKTSYAPDRSEIVYCEKCYQQEVV